MGLDQYMLSSSGEKEYDWRKHARLQVFMARKWREKYPDKEPEGSFNLGFNAGDEPLVLQKADLDEWQEEIKNDYWNSFASDGFFWGQQFQEEQVKEYKKQDQEACDWARTQLEQGHQIKYECSWQRVGGFIPPIFLKGKIMIKQLLLRIVWLYIKYGIHSKTKKNSITRIRKDQYD